MQNKIKPLAKRYLRQCIETRRHLHQNPELSFQEKETSNYIYHKLGELGIQNVKRLKYYGLLVTINGKDIGPCILLRADMDALPIQETNDFVYKSKINNVMHACGHDAHSAMMIYACKMLTDLKDYWSGTIKVIFQPAEEKIPGGAKLMIEQGILEYPKVNRVLGQHVAPWMENGEIGVKKGSFMASSDEIYLTFIGSGGHAAMPHKLVDPLIMASQFMVSAQHLVTRFTDPCIPSVLSFGRIIGSGTTNIIPEKVELDGTLRTMDEALREFLINKVKYLASSVAESFGGLCKVDILNGYPHLLNDPSFTETVIGLMQKYTSNIVTVESWMASEDFAYYAKEVPSCYYLLGCRNESKAITSQLHTSSFNIDESVMELGMGLMAHLAISNLSQL
ncbi:MAG: M20 family metallopeptidase [Cyclobacteriaceae bacterium]